MKKRNCIICGAEFPAKVNQKTCGPECSKSLFRQTVEKSKRAQKERGNGKQFSIWLPNHINELVKHKADERGITQAALIRDLVLKYVKGTAGVYPVTLEVPLGLTDEELRMWLAVKCERIVSRMREMQTI